MCSHSPEPAGPSGAVRVVVLVKQVPAVTQVSVDEVTGNLLRAGVRSVMNPYDLFALEAALRLRDSGVARVTAVSMGPPKAREVLKYALALGVDDAVLLTDQAFAGSDTWATSAVLQAAVRRLGPEVILCGRQAIDGDTGQVPLELAVRLSVPCVTRVLAIEAVDCETVVVRRRVDGFEEVVESVVPAVLTVEEKSCTPRLPTLEGISAVAGRRPVVLGARELGLDPADVGSLGSPTRVVSVRPALPAGGGIILEGSPETQVRELVRRLNDAGCFAPHPGEA